MKVAVACDHAGFQLKRRLLSVVRTLPHQIIDLGAFKRQRDDDYPDYARAIARAIRVKQAERGILVCGSGVGASVAATKFKGIRAGLCHDTYSARQAVEHDDVNVLCLGARVVGEELAIELVRTFLSARFTREARHRRRLAKIEQIESEAA